MISGYPHAPGPIKTKGDALVPSLQPEKFREPVEKDAFQQALDEWLHYTTGCLNCLFCKFQAAAWTPIWLAWTLADRYIYPLAILCYYREDVRL